MITNLVLLALVLLAFGCLLAFVLGVEQTPIGRRVSAWVITHLEMPPGAFPNWTVVMGFLIGLVTLAWWKR